MYVWPVFLLFSLHSVFPYIKIVPYFPAHLFWMGGGGREEEEEGLCLARAFGVRAGFDLWLFP